jgi:HSP20 family protein
MALRWDPWHDLSALERQVGEAIGRVQRPSTGGWAPALDAFQRGDHLVVRVELPGVSPEDIDIHVEDNVLVIRGERHEEPGQTAFLRRERSFGPFERQVVVPEGVDPGAIEASYDLGVLELRIPSPKAEEPRRVHVRVGRQGARTVGVETGAGEGEAPPA